MSGLRVTPVIFGLGLAAQRRPGYGLIIDGDLEVVTGSPVLIARIAELIERHGLADIPDDLAGLCPWPAPNPIDRIIDHTPRNP